MKKYKIVILISFFPVILYQYFKAPVTIEQEKAVDVPIKFHLDRNDKGERLINVYIPYKITVCNNRFKKVKIQSFRDGNWGFGNNLVYNVQGMELNDYSQAHYAEKFCNTYLKYRRTIFPFFSRTFYYYKKHIFFEDKLKYNFREFEYSEYSEQLDLLANELKIPIKKSIIDSLYKSDYGKRLKVHFEDNDPRYLPIFIKTRLNTNEQTYIDIHDSIKGMNEKEAKEYFIKYMTRKSDL